MKLEGLARFTPDQENKIKRFSKRANCFADFEDTDDPDSWVNFRNLLWGNEEALEFSEGKNVEGDDGATSVVQPIVKIPRHHPPRLRFGQFAYLGAL